MKRFSILLLILCTCLTAATAWAGSHIVYVPPPNGTDDTSNIQAALDTCVACGKNFGERWSHSTPDGQQSNKSAS